MAGLDERVVRVYEIIFNNLMRLGLTVLGGYAFIKVLNALIEAKTPLDKGTYAFIEVLIAGTTFWPYRYYFFNKDDIKKVAIESVDTGSQHPALPNSPVPQIVDSIPPAKNTAL